MTSRRLWKTPRAGAIDHLRLVQEPMPELQPGQARIAVRAVGLNFADLFALQGLYSATPDGAFTPGLEFSGVIEKLGPPDNSGGDLRVGDRVMGVIRFGAYADRLNADIRYLSKLPDGWDFAQGAALLAQALTAYYALCELGNLKADQLVLIQSVAGGVGLFALEIVRKMGGRAIGTIGSPDKIPFLVDTIGLHPETILVRDAKRFGKQLDAALQFSGRSGFDLVLDAVAGEFFRPAYDRLRAAGRLILFGSATMMTHASRPNYAKLAWRYLRRPRLDPIEMISENKSLMAFNLIWLWDRVEEMTRLVDELLALNLAPPHVGGRFAFEDAHAALKFFQSGQSTGKVVLEIGASSSPAATAADRTRHRSGDRAETGNS